MILVILKSLRNDKVNHCFISRLKLIYFNNKNMMANCPNKDIIRMFVQFIYRYTQIVYCCLQNNAHVIFIGDTK